MVRKYLKTSFKSVSQLPCLCNENRSISEDAVGVSYDIAMKETDLTSLLGSVNFLPCIKRDVWLEKYFSVVLNCCLKFLSL